MLVATPGQAATYSTLHNSSSNGGGSNNANAATAATTKKSSISSTASGTSKPLNNNNNHTASTVTTKSSLNSNSNSTIHNYHPNTKNDNIVLNKLGNQNKSTAASSREILSSSKKTATAHSLKTENSTNTTSTTNNKPHSFIQTLKDSVQKALISTTGTSNNTNSIASKHSTDNKLQNNCNNSKTSVNNVTSSSSATSHNAIKVSTTTSLNSLSNATAATQSSSSASVVRGKHFSCSVSKLHTVAPTILHRYPEERQHASSTDSLHKEMCHFKPIRIVPKTPFKSGSKSRGNSLRFPKANLATKKTEYVLKSNCDVNNRKRKQHQNQTENDNVIVDADEDDENEQENKAFRIYKPKPSLTCLSTLFNTPNHTSAFVCPIEDMKNLVNMQSKNQLLSASVDEPDDSFKELFVRKKQKPAKKQLLEDTIKETPKRRGSRQLTKTVAKNINTKQNAKTNNISKGTTVAITKTKSLRNVGRAKSKTVNMTALRATKTKTRLQNSISMPDFATDKNKAVASTSRSTRKRKAAPEDDLDCGEHLMMSTLSISPLPKKSTSNKSLVLTARKSSRLSAKEREGASANKRARYSANEIFTQNPTIKNSQKNNINPKTVVSFSPPMTRSRLKHLTEQGKIAQTDVTVTRKRKI